MEERNHPYPDHPDPLIRDIRILMDILTPLVSSYRLLVGAADELNRITLAHKGDLKDAINRADDMGHIIDDIDDKLKTLVKALLRKIESNHCYDRNFKQES